MKSSASFNKKLLSTLIAACIATGAYAQSDDVEEVVVTGIKASLANSVSVKRNSASVVDAISAEDIGKLPDTTIADSLQRVPGIQIRRNAGEGSTVNVRGMPQVSTLLNGEQFLSAGSITTAQPDFTDIPAELLSRVDVIKSAQASTLAAGVAGTIDLKTRRPFDLDDGWTFAGSAEGSQGQYTDDETGHKVSGFAGFNNGDNFGALLSVSNSKATLANFRYGMYSDWWFRGYNENGDWPGQGTPGDLTGDGDTNDQVFGTIDYGVTNRTAERERTGISGTAQFQLNDQVEFLADVFYTKMDQGDYVNGLIADNSWAQYDWVNPDLSTLVNRGPAVGGSGKDFYTSSITNLEALRVIAKGETQIDKRESLNFNLQANVELSDKLSGSVRYAHGNATNDHTGSFADALITSGMQSGLQTSYGGVKAPANPGGYGPNGERVPVIADFSGEHPSIQYPDGFGQDINSYGLVSAFSHQNRDEESTLDVFRIDGTYDFQDGVKVDFGYRFADREIERNQYDLIAPFTVKDANGNNVTVYSKWKDSGIPGVSGGDTIAKTFKFTELQDLGYIHQVSDFGPASDGNSYYFIDPKAMKNTAAFHEALYPGNVKQKDGSQSFVVGDQTQTFYFQGSFEGEAGLPYQANFGMQYVETSLDITQFIPSVDTTKVTVDGTVYPALDGVAPTIANTEVVERNFNDFLPRFNIAFDTSDDTKLRFAYSKTMTQLDANDLGLGRTYTTNNNPDLGVFQVVSASQNGNPYMEPWRADNLDLSYEWYFTESGMLSLGLFRVDVETSIATATIQIPTVADSDGVNRRPGETIDLTTRDNTDGGVVKGMELGYQQAFDFLPGAWSGLGATVNYTFTDGQGGEKDFYGKTMPMADNSEDQVNAVLWYEYDQWQARIAYNYRSERFIGRAWNDGSPAAWWQAPTAYVDASVSYDFNDNVTVYLQGTNITEEFEETYMQWSDVVVNQNVYEARYTVGVRAKF
jgi:iron complex outermembrane receptor protein